MSMTVNFKFESVAEAPNEETACAVNIAHVRYGVAPSHFSGELSIAMKKALFKRYVTRITLEISSYCNRICVFCPNKSGIRRDKEQLKESLSQDRLASILASLKSIAYDKGIILHLYNEPMADPGLPEKVAMIAEALPAAVIWTNTNGDYLTRERLVALTRAGMRKLEVSLYGPRDGGNYDQDYLSKAFARVFETIGQKAPITRNGPDDMRARVTLKEGERQLQITIFARDFNTVGYDRGKSVAAGPVWTRTSPCTSVFNEFNMGWDGSVVPCCNIHPNDPDHTDYVIGRVKEGDDIFHLYHSTALREWRRKLAKFGPTYSPCDTCTRGDYPGLGESDKAEAYNAVVDEILGKAKR
jgi:Radical SAM superfamily/Iron-sulfur cluster-binding domain